MKLTKLFKGDIRFQYKYGFYFVYFVFTFMYIVLINLLPDSISQQVAFLLIFSDPSAIGLIFMGAIIHLEISEKTIYSLYIAPIKSSEYLMAKLLSISFISTLVGIAIGVATQVKTNYIWFIMGLVIGSMIFSCFGLILSFKTRSLNQFFLSIIPVMILVTIPGIMYMLGIDHPILILHPGVSIIELLTSGDYVFSSFLILIVWLILFFQIANRIVYKKFRQEMGGIHEASS